ncbi:MAG TPA: RNA polymerase factor sigma-54 [Bacteroidales bacterium]|jgi:RNA polymerase sigma-54 factor|nr:RNA polymerase factor sigma-54 [Bacteroidales bacterium]MDD4087878.1 RNA polymerase factor sigma-54 [Bacteroidales bacterium]MDY0084961.1 RNA polymerase factor sigma-54 [Bacteroidales bacterium]HPE42506.1 RNA polymerase factor sigma-54 [Bacteroidales bacterium]
MLNQRLQQKLLQKLSPQQILLMKLLQIPSVALEQRIKQEIEENPALEIEEGEQEQEDTLDDFEDDTADDFEAEDEYDSTDDEFDFDDYLDDDDIASYKLAANNSSPDDDRYEMPFSSHQSFQDFLLQQLGYRKLDEREHIIGEYIIGNLDDAGYLNRPLDALADDLLFALNIKTNRKELLEVLKVIQDFDPPGVGARNLQECLLIQLYRLQEEELEKDYRLAIMIVDRFFNEFTKKHYDKILKRAEISEDELKDALTEILKLNPKPGNSMSDAGRTSQYVMPDFIIFNNDGELELTLSSRNTPELRVSKAYAEMLETYSENKKSKSNKDAVVFVKQKIDSARWFIDAIKQRQNTLYLTMHAIMNYQYEYFLTGDETKLKPMILKDIAEIVNLDISTISRVANSKYVQTPFGTFLLKSFFSESMQNDEGEEVSTREIKKILSDCIDAENKSKPVTDEQLTTILKEKGYNIARRTVAKYREQLNIPVARLRKEL